FDCERAVLSGPPGNPLKWRGLLGTDQNDRAILFLLGDTREAPRPRPHDPNLTALRDRQQAIGLGATGAPPSTLGAHGGPPAYSAPGQRSSSSVLSVGRNQIASRFRGQTCGR